MTTTVVLREAAREECRPDTAMAAALLRLINAAGLAVDSDGNAARSCLARATALLVADRKKARSIPIVADLVPRGGLPRWQAKQLAAYIDEHLGDPIRSRDLIALTSLSAGHFFRTFRVTFGEAPFAYIARRRIEHAQQLMLTTREPLCQIALACGLCDQSHLTRLFHRFVGTSPRIWRREQAHASAIGGSQ